MSFKKKSVEKTTEKSGTVKVQIKPIYRTAFEHFAAKNNIEAVLSSNPSERYKGVYDCKGEPDAIAKAMKEVTKYANNTVEAEI